MRYHLDANLKIYRRSGFFTVTMPLLLNDADVYLKNLYGDFMQIPPPEKRQKHFVRELRL